MGPYTLGTTTTSIWVSVRSDVLRLSVMHTRKVDIPNSTAVRSRIIVLHRKQKTMPEGF